jgi:hypothetical protein
MPTFRSTTEIYRLVYGAEGGVQPLPLLARLIDLRDVGSAARVTSVAESFCNGASERMRQKFLK